MVAGWDRLLPEWFSRLHPRHKTPTGAILFTGALTLIVLVMANAGVASQEAFQLLNNGCRHHVRPHLSGDVRDSVVGAG